MGEKSYVWTLVFALIAPMIWHVGFHGKQNNIAHIGIYTYWDFHGHSTLVNVGPADSLLLSISLQPNKRFAENLILIL